jgi:hypothetical protein
MKHRSIHYGTAIPALLMTLALTCLCCLTTHADPPGPPTPPDENAIVGLWQVVYTGACQPPVLPPQFLTYQQFHSDGVEIETPMFAPGVCMGVWKRMGPMIHIYHVGWTPGGVPGVPNSVRFVFTETLVVSHDHNSYDGTVDQTFYDAPVGGNVVAHCMSTTHGTRISVN